MIVKSSVFIIVNDHDGMSPLVRISRYGLVGPPEEIFSPSDSERRVVIIGMF